MTSPATAVDDYLATLPDDRRAALAAVLATVRQAMPAGYEERFLSGMIEWSIPLERYPDTYNRKPLGVAVLAAQKNHLALYLMAPYMDATLEQRLRNAFAAAGRKLDMGKSCIRFRRAEDLDLDGIADVIRAVPPERFISMYEAARAGRAAQ